MRKMGRREFLTGSAATIAAFSVVPRHVLGGAGFKAPSEKLNIAGIGIGGMGRVDLQNVSGENIAALCDVDEEYAGKVFAEYPQAKRYRDFREMLQGQKDIDAVVIATPDHLHAVVAMTAVKLGKHVYCEKPLTYTLYEARALVEASRKAKVATQMGNYGHSSEGIRLVCEWIWDGAIGEVTEVYAWTPLPAGLWAQGVDKPQDRPAVPKTLDWDLWLGPAPERDYNPAYAPFKWRGWWDFGTGALGDQACHTLDVPFWALKLGHAESVEASFTRAGFPEPVINKESYPLASIVRYRFPAREGKPAVKVSWYDGGLMPERPAELEQGARMGNQYGGVLFVGSKGKLMCGTFGEGPRLLPEQRMKEYQRPTKTIARSQGHYQDWLNACRGGEPAGSNFDYAGPLTEMALLGNLAIRMGGEKLEWDGEKMKVTNNDEANKYVHREYRAGWSL